MWRIFVKSASSSRGLFQHAGDPRRDGASFDVPAQGGGDQNNRKEDVPPFQLGHDGKAVHVGHLIVEHKAKARRDVCRD